MALQPGCANGRERDYMRCVCVCVRACVCVRVCVLGLPRWLSSKESACQAGETGSIPWLGRSPEEGNGNPLQYSCLDNPVDRGAWWAAVHGVIQSWTQLKQLSMLACIGEGNGNPLQYSCLENPRDRGA